MESASSIPLFFLLILLAALSSTITTAYAGGAVNDLLYYTCSQPKSPQDAALYLPNVNSLLASLANAAGFSLYSNFTSSLAPPPVYGLYQCNADLSIPACESCVHAAISQLSSACAASAGGAVRLRGCLVRYDKDALFGKADKSLLYKSCGPAAAAPGGAAEVVGMRDAVAAAIAAGAGQYRVAGGGAVQGVGQCVGDQGPKQCNDCLGEAVADLKSFCGAAVAGEVYLGKCYAAYATRGFYYDSRGGGGDRNDHASEAGKDVAIIIAVVAAILFIILFLNYLRKSSEDKGKK